MLTGYIDRLSGRPGETIEFHVSSPAGPYGVQLVRLINGDRDPRGIGPREEVIRSQIDGNYNGYEQKILGGSYVRAPGVGLDRLAGGIGANLWFFPTLLECRRQTLLACVEANGTSGFQLSINEQNRLELIVHMEGGPVILGSDRELRPGQWVRAACSIDFEKRKIVLCHMSRDFDPSHAGSMLASTVMPGTIDWPQDGRLYIGAAGEREPQKGNGPINPYNGKISAPAVWFSPVDIDKAITFGSPASGPADIEWKFHESEFCPPRVPDGRHGEFDGVPVNLPAAWVTGHNWDGSCNNAGIRPEQYNCLHFHDDDLEDARWDKSFELKIPETLRSGVYAARIEGEDASRTYLPFFVLPPPRAPAAALAVLVPTLSYQAYANFILPVPRSAENAPSLSMRPFRNPNLNLESLQYIADNHLTGLYSRHRDGSGVCFSSLRRPILDFRPDYRFSLFDAPKQFSADLHLIDWLEAKGFDHDVITDHDLHREGVALLQRYKCVTTCTHNEYATRPMLDAIKSYQDAGGRFISLSGNTFYWVTGIGGKDQDVAEVRRGVGQRAWTASPGETFLCFTGEEGGLWRDRGRPPQMLTGVGMAATGLGRGSCYRRTKDSKDPRAQFIFEGIDAELIGDFPSLVLQYGAAGFELDRADVGLGTPRHALVVASATDFSDSYQRTVEEVATLSGYSGGLWDESIRADMVFYETPNGGAVFSVGSITWCAALSYNGYRNTVSQVTENVIRRFTL